MIRRHFAAAAGLVCICWTAVAAQQTAVRELGIK